MTDATSKIILEYISTHGEEVLLEKLNQSSLESTKILTIICNQGVHPLNDLHKRGEVFYASQGNLDFSDEVQAINAITQVLKKVAKKLKSHSWEKVYLVPFGPAVLSMQIKNLVYRVLHIDTIDILHIGNGIHVDIEIDSRDIAVEA